MGKTISVIVPVYQVEVYLEKCIQSILQQSYKNLEIILVDDGSKDNCPAICDSYQEKDARVKVIHKRNGGLSSARNAALDIATGEYITFVDSDDYIDTRMIETLMSYIEKENSDIAVCFWQEVWEKEQSASEGTSWQGVENATVESMNQVQAMEKMLYQRGCDSCAWGKLFKRELFQTIRFPEQKIYEDIAIMYQVFGMAKKVVFSNYQGYYYLQRNASISKAQFNVNKMSLIDFTKQNEKYIEENYPELMNAARSRTVRANFHMYMQIPVKEEYQEYRSRIEDNIKARRTAVLRDKGTGMGTKAALLMTYLGFGFFLACKNMKNWGKTM